MAITIRSRQGTQIGYKGTSGGSVSWINQAGQAGRQLASLGNTIINSADNVSKIFDSEVSASEKKQQVDDLTVAYLQQSRSWQKDLQNGGFKLDANGIPEFELNPNYFTDISNQHHEKFWKDYVDGKDLDSEAVSAFGVYFQNSQKASFNNAATWGRTQRFTRLKAKDTTNLSALLLTIKTDKSIRNKNDAFTALNNIVQTGAPHRDSAEMKNVFIAAKKALIESSSIEIAFGQQGKNQVPSDIQNGYTAEDYTKAMANISEHPVLDRNQKLAIITNLESNRKLRVSIEKTNKATADNSIQTNFSKLHSEGKLTISLIENSSIDFKQKMFWKGQLEGGSKKPWKGDFNEIGNKINTGTWSEENDIARTPEVIVAEVIKEAQLKGIPYLEINKLVTHVRAEAKLDPINVLKKSAEAHAKQVFQQKLTSFELIMMGQLGAKAKGAMASEIKAAQENKIWKFKSELNLQLAEGRKNGLTWNKMLSPNSPDYIVNDIIDNITNTEPKSIGDLGGQNEVEEESFFDNVIDSVVDFFSSDDDEDAGSGVEDNIIHEIYGKKSYFKKDITFEQAKAKVDSKYAAEHYDGDMTQRITYPESHKGYSQYPEGRETLKAFKERMRLMGLKINRLGVYK
ncbi:MAG TPA: hypothetical protein EYN08_03595 [Gammaproteobacteria bacterium]|nr:hypothetical protein [Gammaproteobacteria bacterium]